MRLPRLPILFAALLAVTSPAWAATEIPFTQQAFTEAQIAGKPILVHITAPWCPVCAKQHPIIEKLKADARFNDLAILDVDFDSQKDVVRAMGAQMQSTLVVFHGAAEKGRSTGDTNAASIETLLDKSHS